MPKKIAKNIFALSIGLLLSFVLAEGVLRIYNPFPSRFRGDKIQLKTNLKKKMVISPAIEGLDSVIQYSVNSLGFRGEEKPDNPSYSIITVGGSTTECSKLDDEKTWTAVLGKKLKEEYPNVWINNAGMDGATTYGHNILLDDYILKLKPNMVVFLIGVNDRGKRDFSKEDAILIDRRESFVKKLIKRSEVANLANNLYMMYKTHQVNIGHNSGKATLKDLDEDQPVDSTFLLQIQNEHALSLEAYKVRVQQLAEKCWANGIKPVFATQPLIYGGEGWAIMQLYNEVVRQYCMDNHLLCVDVANELPKKAMYYYDEMHYTNKGASAVADIIYEQIKDHLN
jgi:lysophospholipase L1-like esterase